MLKVFFYNTLKRMIEVENYESKETMQITIDTNFNKKRITATQKAELERLLYLTDKEEVPVEPK